MFGDMMGKLQEAQKQAEETKQRLNTVYLSEESAGGKIKITRVPSAIPNGNYFDSLRFYLISH